MKKVLVFSLVAMLFASVLVGCSSGPKQLTLGFVPSTDAKKLADNAQPLADMLAKEIGIPVKAFTSTNFAALSEAMGTKQNPVDIGFLPPFGYVLANQENGAKVILKSSRNGATSYKAQFITKVGSGVSKIEDVKGKKFGFVDPASASGYVFPGAFLKSKGIDIQKDIQAVMLGSHDAVVKAVYNGDVAAGVCFDDARDNLLKEFPDVKTKVSIVTYTDAIPNDTVSVRKDLDPALTQKISDALLKIAATKEGKQLLLNIYNIDGFAAASDKDYEVVRMTAKNMNINLKTGK
jgi:phosphonate transport system substrate-binding protein